MKNYVGKNLEDLLEKVAKEENLAIEDLNYYVVEEKKTLFSKKIEICVYTLADVVEYASSYLKKTLANLELESEIKSRIEDGVIHLEINTPHNAVLIGKNGKTLQSFNEITRNAVNATFKRRFRILLDINNYKDQKYEKIVRIAVKVAKDVQKSKITAKLDPMTSDERRVVHNALAGMNNIKTESIGQGPNRQITIVYVEN
jgi:spoIIIJ-associated protein